MSIFGCIITLLLLMVSSYADERVHVSDPIARVYIHNDLLDGDKCLTPPNMRKIPGRDLEMRSCVGAVNQLFEWDAIGFKIKLGTFCVDVLRDKGPPQPGDQIVLWYCRNTLNQGWLPIQSVRDSLKTIIINRKGSAGDLCLTVLGPFERKRYGKVALAKCDERDGQLFRIESVIRSN